jgi:hypothetical protein
MELLFPQESAGNESNYRVMEKRGIPSHWR